jgi:GT2 family glycosyltransferase
MRVRRPKVSIVVLNWRGEAETATCVASVLGQRYLGPIEIIVVDNESTNASRRRLAELEGCRVLPLGRNLGFAGGMNAGAQAATGELLGLLNNDLVIAPDWVERGVGVLFSRADVGIVGGASYVWDADNPPFSESNRTWGRHYLDSVSGSATLTRAGLGRTEVWALDGSNLFIRRSLWERVGGFDADYFAYGEDIDLCARCAAAGAVLLYEPTMRTWHRRNASSNRLPLRRLYWSRRNHLSNVAKHFPEAEWRKSVRRLSAEYVWYGLSGRATGVRSRGQSPRLDTRTRVASVAAGAWGSFHGRHLTAKRRDVLALGLHDERWRDRLDVHNDALANHV